MNKKLRDKAVQLRLEGQMSYSEIRKKLKVPKSTLSYWLHDYPLSESRIQELRKKSWKKGEASRERFRNTMRKKRLDAERIIYNEEVRRLKLLSEDALYVAGLMLYAAEGTKKGLYRIGIANTDSTIILFFMWWLKTFYQVPKISLRFQLHLYENMNIPSETKFWLKSLDIQETQLYKTQVKKVQKGSFTYSGSFRHGTCSLFFSSGEKKTKIMAAIRAFFDLHTT